VGCKGVRREAGPMAGPLAGFVVFNEDEERWCRGEIWALRTCTLSTVFCIRGLATLQQYGRAGRIPLSAVTRQAQQTVTS